MQMPTNPVPVWLACLAVFLISPTVDAQNAQADVRADRLQIDHQRHLATFEGRVEATYGRLQLTCDQMTVEYDDQGQVIALMARGRVTVKREDATATAGTARLDATHQQLVLEQSPLVVQGSHRLAGKRIAINLDTGRIDVSEASGRFTLKMGPK